MNVFGLCNYNTRDNKIDYTENETSHVYLIRFSKKKKLRKYLVLVNTSTDSSDSKKGYPTKLV